jgi:hypothetical protein
MKTRKLTTETILETEDFEIIFTKGVNLDVCYPYQIFDNDDDLVHECDERQEAIDYVTEEQEALDAERAENYLNSLKDQANELLADCEDEATIKKVLAMLKRAK